MSTVKSNSLFSMSSLKKRLQFWLVNLGELAQAILSFAMAKMHWLMAFNASPAALVVKPLLALVLFVLVIFQAYDLYQADKLEFVPVFQWVANLFNTGLTNTSIIGGITALVLQTTFVAGPWLLVAALGVGLIQELVMLGFNSYKALTTEFQAHHLQACVKNSLNIFLLSSTMAAVLLTLFSPVAPMVLATLAFTVGTLLVATILWKCLPEFYRQQIKQGLGFGKPSLTEIDTNVLTNQIAPLRKEPVPIVDAFQSSQRHSLRFWSQAVVEEDGNESVEKSFML